jgi:hypothetical protein
MDLHYRRVWQHIGGAWQIVAEGTVRAFGMNCTLEGPSYCSIGPPYIFERWWRWSPGTYGSQSSKWLFVGEQGNW